MTERFHRFELSREERAKIVRLRTEHRLSLTVIAARLSITRHTVSEILKEAGVETFYVRP